MANVNLFEIRHLRRSGGHAIISWLFNHYDNYIFFNDVRLNGSFPQKESEGIEINNVFYSYENKDLEYFAKPNFKIVEKIGLGHLKINPKFINVANKNIIKKREIIILRDPLNWASSHIKARMKDKTNNLKEIDLDLFINYFKSPTYKINYNKWFVDYDYRRIIENDLDMPLGGDKSMSVVKNYGGGSSFDGLEFNNNANNMNVLNRWLEFKNHKKIQTILDNKILRNICLEYFEMKI